MRIKLSLAGGGFGRSLFFLFVWKDSGVVESVCSFIWSEGVLVREKVFFIFLVSVYLVASA